MTCKGVAGIAESGDALTDEYVGVHEQERLVEVVHEPLHGAAVLIGAVVGLVDGASLFVGKLREEGVEVEDLGLGVVDDFDVGCDGIAIYRTKGAQVAVVEDDDTGRGVALQQGADAVAGELGCVVVNDADSHSDMFFLGRAFSVRWMSYVRQSG